MPKIAIFDAKDYDRDFFSRANSQYDFSLTFLETHLHPETKELVKGYDAVCAFVNDRISAEVLEALAREKIGIIALRCAGYNNVDLAAAYKKVHVVRVPRYSPYAVAEHTLALMLSLNRKTHRAYYRTRESNFTLQGLLGFDMHGKTIGIIGTGAIGRLVAGIVQSLGMRVLLYDPKPNREWASSTTAEYTDLAHLYAESDIITLHCPLTPDNTHMINADSLSHMKPGVMLINTGRGKLIDTSALIDALKARRVGSAGLDVYEEETDYFFEDFSDSIITDDTLGRLLSFPNVLVTAHQGFFTREALTAIAETTLSNLHTYFTEGTVPNEICYRCDQPECRHEKEQKCF